MKMMEESVLSGRDISVLLMHLSVLPNNIFIQVHLKNTDISPTLRDLEPGYVSNLAEFWTQKALRDNPGSNESIKISGDLLLQEDSSTLEAEDFIKLAEDFHQAPDRRSGGTRGREHQAWPGG